MVRLASDDHLAEMKNLFTTVRLEDFVPADHPLRPIRVWVNDALAKLSASFDKAYATDAIGGRPSIAPEKLVRAMLLQVLYSVRSERSWAMGDYADLRTILDRSSADGAGVVVDPSEVVIRCGVPVTIVERALFDEMRRVVGILRENSIHLQKLIEDLLRHGEAEFRAARIEIKSFSLPELVAQVGFGDWSDAGAPCQVSTQRAAARPACKRPPALQNLNDPHCAFCRSQWSTSTRAVIASTIGTARAMLPST